MLTGIEGNSWSVGPARKLLSAAFGCGQQFANRSDRLTVVLDPSQQLYTIVHISDLQSKHIFSQPKIRLPGIKILHELYGFCTEQNEISIKKNPHVKALNVHNKNGHIPFSIYESKLRVSCKLIIF